MPAAQALIAILLPWTVTALWLRRLQADGPPLDWPTCLGYGFFVGVYLTVLLMHLVDAAGLGLHSRLILGVWLLAGIGALFLAVKRRGSAETAAGGAGVAQPDRMPPSRIARWLWWGLLGLVLFRLGVIAAEIALRPVTPWDAWTTWLLRSRVWFELATLVPFVDAEAWLVADSPQVFTIEAHHYPGTVSMVPAWVALNVGAWHEPLALSPWFAALVAMLLALYGQVRRLGGSALDAMLVVYLLVSIPMVTAHTALAGYADLWVAATIVLAAGSLWIWRIRNERLHLLLAMPLLAALPTLKLEGSAWLLALIAGTLLGLLRPRTVLLLAALGAAGLAAWIRLGGFALEIPGLGAVALESAWMIAPGPMSLSLGPQPEAFGALLTSMFQWANWHLLWFVALALSPLVIHRYTRDPRVRGPSYTIAILLGMLLALFLLTDAAQWVVQQTSVNRLLLHATPILVLFLWMSVRMEKPV